MTASSRPCSRATPGPSTAWSPGPARARRTPASTASTSPTNRRKAATASASAELLTDERARQAGLGDGRALDGGAGVLAVGAVGEVDGVAEGVEREGVAVDLAARRARTGPSDVPGAVAALDARWCARLGDLARVGRDVPHRPVDEATR